MKFKGNKIEKNNFKFNCLNLYKKIKLLKMKFLNMFK